MIEQLKPLTDALNERAKNPIIGGFVFSWLVVNFKHWSLLIVGPIDEYPTRLSDFLAASNACNFLYQPLFYAVLVYFFIYVGSFIVSLLNIGHLWFIAKCSKGLAESQNKILKLQNEGKDYVDMQTELKATKASLGRSELIIKATNDLRGKLDAEMKNNAKIEEDRVKEKADEFRKEILESCNNNTEISTQLDEFLKFVKLSVDKTYNSVSTPVRKHVSIVEKLEGGNLT
ncbi:hypothetical protein [Vibrio sp. McD22-P3]|uniref:hypothetical protein n=1 Tax=Vibrio sp. McD22-P3 TaxID=2724880 RepID=UPI001F1F91DC|nr:hypothetical protein [Vibrio sp. McD22-P3]MCF4176885.1 hypothetical protein [Vibrio sp. McD22-P3]